MTPERDAGVIPALTSGPVAGGLTELGPCPVEGQGTGIGSNITDRDRDILVPGAEIFPDVDHDLGYLSAGSDDHLDHRPDPFVFRIIDNFTDRRRSTGHPGQAVRRAHQQSVGGFQILLLDRGPCGGKRLERLLGRGVLVQLSEIEQSDLGALELVEGCLRLPALHRCMGLPQCFENLMPGRLG